MFSGTGSTQPKQRETGRPAMTTQQYNNSPYFFLGYAPQQTILPQQTDQRKVFSHQVHHLTTNVPAPTGQHLQPYPRHFKEHNEQQPVQHHGRRTTISNLYPEIMTIIFCKLEMRDKGRVAQVCSSWRDAVYAKRCWKGIEAKLHLRKASKSVFSSLIKRGIRRVHVLSLRRHLKDVVSCLPNLESLNLSGTYNINDSVIVSAFQLMQPNLKVLNLSLCKQVTDESLKRISMSLTNLEVLEVQGCGNITDAGLAVIGWGLKKLKSLNIRSCWHVSDHGIDALVNQGETNATTTSCLQSLGLQDCQQLTDEALKFIADGIPALECINLSFCVSITDAGLKHLSQMQNLRALNLSTCENVTDLGLAYLCEGSAHSLRALDLSFCAKIGDTGLEYVAQSMFHLRSLNLSACKITDDGLTKVVHATQELENLQIGQCVAITDKSVDVFAEKLQNLRAIDIYGCNKITPLGLAIIEKLPKLEQLGRGIWSKR